MLVLEVEWEVLALARRLGTLGWESMQLNLRVIVLLWLRLCSLGFEA
jgi:hypothetical protein